MHHTSQGMYKKNILSKSLNIEVLKSSVAILFIFFFLVIGSRFVGYFEQASEGLLDPNIILKVVVLRFPDFITLLIPFSFFLGVVVTISRMYAENEIYGYFSAGLSKNNLLKFLFPQAIAFFFSTLILSLFVAPYTKELSKDMLSVDSFQDQFESIKPNKIFMFNEGDGFIYSDKKNDDVLEGVTIFLSDGDSSSLILSDSMTFQNHGAELDLEFEDGKLHQGIFESKNQITSDFGKLKIPIDNDTSSLSGLSLSKLFDYSLKSSKSEFLWNISIPITIFILLLIGISISKVEPRQGRLSVFFPAIAIYIFYLSLLILTRDLIDGDNSLSQYYIWLTHLLFLFIGLFGLFWQDFLKPNIIFKKGYFPRIMLIIFIIFLFVWIVS